MLRGQVKAESTDELEVRWVAERAIGGLAVRRGVWGSAVVGNVGRGESLGERGGGGGGTRGRGAGKEPSRGGGSREVGGTGAERHWAMISAKATDSSMPSSRKKGLSRRTSKRPMAQASAWPCGGRQMLSSSKKGGRCGITASTSPLCSHCSCVRY